MRIDLGFDEPRNRAHQFAVLFGIKHHLPSPTPIAAGLHRR
jgi:hypothetical protein